MSAPETRERSKLCQETPTTDLPVRDIARGLVLDPQDRVLLIEYEASRDVDPARPGFRRFWFLPGGGLEAGENHREGLKRELEEEIGVADAPIGPEVGRFEGPFLLFSKPRFSRERYFVVRLANDRIDTARLAETEDNPVFGVRWWRIEDLETTTDRIEPAGLVALARRVLSGEVPSEPVPLGNAGKVVEA